MRPKTLSVTHPVNRWPARIYWLSTFLLAVAFLAALVVIAIHSEFNWPEVLFLLFATVSTMAALTRQLPLQNVLFAALLIAIIGGTVHAIGAQSGIPFGPFLFEAEAGWKIFGLLPWCVPLLWMVIVLNSRGVARLILRPWRKMRTYGLWLIGMTALFTMLFDCALEPFAAHIKHYWIWISGGLSLMPLSAPLSNSLGWFVVTLLILAFTTPLLINKQLSKRSAPDFHPLAVWLGGIVLFAIAAALNGLWAAVAVDAVIGIVVIVFVIRGVKW